MADFWGGVGKGFAHGFEKSYDSAARRRERKDERDDRLTDLKEAAINTAIADYIKAGGTRTGAIASRDLEVLQTETAELLKAQNDAVLKRADDKTRRSAMSTLAKAHPDVQKEAYQSVGGIPIEGTNYLDDARTFSPTTAELKKTPLDVLGMASARSEAQQTIANELAKEKRDAEEAQAAATLAHQRRLIEKGTLAPQHPKPPVDYAGKLQHEKDLSKIPTRPSGTPASPTLHKRIEDLLAIISNPDTPPADKKTAQQVLDTLKPPAAGRAPTTLEKQEEYVKTINDPKKSLEEKQFASEMLSFLKKDTIEVFDPVSGQPTLRIGPSGAGAKAGTSSDIDSALLDLKRIKESFNPDKPQVGWIATIKSGVGDKFLTQFGFEGWADEQRAQYRQDVEEFSNKYVKALNQPDPKLTDMDRKMLKPLAPGINDSPFMFAQKIRTIDRKFKLHSKFNSAYEGKKDVWSMSLRDILDDRTVNPVTGKSKINDELAAFALKENHGLRGSGKDQLLKEATNLWEEKKITEDELAFWMKSVFGR
jgi:hypothetical protein